MIFDRLRALISVSEHLYSRCETLDWILALQSPRNTIMGYIDAPEHCGA